MRIKSFVLAPPGRFVATLSDDADERAAESIATAMHEAVRRSTG